MRTLSRTLLLLALAGAPFAGAHAANALEDCPSSYDFDGAVDYYDPVHQTKIRGIEGNHLNADVENLVRGQSSTIAGDLRFILREIPNHHRAMAALARLALRENQERFPESNQFTVTCWLHRATVFNAGDAQAFTMLGVYLGRKGDTKESIEQLLIADRLLPNDAEISYNLGLMYFEAGDFQKSLSYAKAAYSRGFPLQGLQRKLKEAGKWKD